MGTNIDKRTNILDSILYIFDEKKNNNYFLPEDVEYINENLGEIVDMLDLQSIEATAALHADFCDFLYSTIWLADKLDSKEFNNFIFQVFVVMEAHKKYTKRFKEVLATGDTDTAIGFCRKNRKLVTRKIIERTVSMRIKLIPIMYSMKDIYGRKVKKAEDVVAKEDEVNIFYDYLIDKFTFETLKKQDSELLRKITPHDLMRIYRQLALIILFNRKGVAFNPSVANTGKDFVYFMNFLYDLAECEYDEKRKP